MEVVEPAADPDAATAEPRRLALFGGTFDPPHLGHLVLAAAAAEQFDLDRVLFIPAGLPPNKQGQPISSTTDRLLMTRLAIAGEPRFELSTIEVERPGPSYTIETVEELGELYAGLQLLLLMAADSLAQIDTWREPDRLLSMVEWLVGPRPGSELPERAALQARFGELSDRIHFVDAPALAISSSDLRDRVAEGRSIRYLVPRAVEEQIARRRLYRRPRR
jgi:nicotinate-nucleotide adenylyltransferase